MDRERYQGATGTANIRVRLDRIAFAGSGPGTVIEFIKGFKREKDTFVRPSGRIATYARVRRFHSVTSTAKIILQYQPRLPWLNQWRVMMIAHDETGIPREDVDKVLSHFSAYRITLFELAFDFPWDLGVDDEFVRRHGVFGKSRKDRVRWRRGRLRYGHKKSPKFVRCYSKEGLSCYRVEVEAHSALLRRYEVSNVAHLGHFGQQLLRSHFKFVRFSWADLERHLERKFGEEGQVLLVKARLRAAKSLRFALFFLKVSGVLNPHRFLWPLRLNHDIKSAFRQWLIEFYRAEDQEVDVHL